MQMENIQMLQELFDSKILAVLKLFFRHPERKFYLLEIAKESGVASATTYRMMQKLTSLGLIRQIKVNKFKLYQLNQNDNVEFLQGFIREDIQVLKLFTNSIKDMEEIEAIILHGKETGNKANLLIIGENVDSAKISAQCAAIKEKYDFTITSLALTRDQYEQMSSMGLYSGQKKVIYKK